MPQIQRATILIVLCPRKQVLPVWIEKIQNQGRWCVTCNGASAAHVMHVIDLSMTMLYELDWWPGIRGLEYLWNHPCDCEGNASVLAHRVSRARLTHAMARYVDANLDTIKAKLWAPEGRLVQRMMAKEMGVVVKSVE